jgi:hypothetical protein
MPATLEPNAINLSNILIIISQSQERPHLESPPMHIQTKTITPTASEIQEILQISISL